MVAETERHRERLWWMRKGRKLAVAVAATILFVAIRYSVAQEKMDESVRMLFDLANQERTSRGIRPLKWDGSLADAARQHAMKMAEQNVLSHQLLGELDVAMREKDAGARITAAAENIAYGPNVAGIHTAWMHSPGHRRNLLNPQYNSVGIAVVQRGNLFWAVQDFSHSLADLSVEAQEKAVAKEIRTAGLTIRFDNGDARRVCEGGQPRDSRPMLIARLSSTDLSEPPESLVRILRSGRYVQAEIGACIKPATDGLNEYHIAVLFY